MRNRSLRNVLFVLVVLTLLLNGCGGGGSNGGPGPDPKPQDFTLTVLPETVPLIAGNANTFTVTITSVNGFSSAVSVEIGSLPTGVSASPSTFSLNPGSQQIVTLSASLASISGSITVRVSAKSGEHTHYQSVTLQLAVPALDRHSPGRTRYLRTDTLNHWGFLSYYPQQNFAVYDSVTRRIFLTDARLNTVIVFDSVQEIEIARITIPGAWSLDLSPDHSILWVGTQVGDLYEADPVALTIKRRIPSVEIGPLGFGAFEPRALSDGKVALLGTQGGIPFIDGYAEVGIWDPAVNSIQIFTTYYGQAVGSPGTIVCGAAGNFGTFQLSADRTKIYLGSAFSDSTFCELDPSNGQYRTITTPVGFIDTILPTKDGKTLIIANAQLASVYEAVTLAFKSKFGPGGGIGSATAYFYLLTYDGKGLYVFDKDNGDAYLYDYNTWQTNGWIAGINISDYAQQNSVSAQVVDETGLVFGELSHGVGFVDTSIVNTGIYRPASNGYATPAFGPASGGTQVQIYGGRPDSFNFGELYFGNSAVPAPSMSGSYIYADTPGGPKGPVDITMISSTGSISILPEAFSYGPHIVQTLPTHTTIDGGAIGTIFGYGFGPTNTTNIPGDLQVSVGGQIATITAFSTNEMYSGGSYPFPMQRVDFRLPSGTVGSKVNITVSNPSGSDASSGAIAYIPTIKTYTHPGSTFLQGVYDKTRDLYYFTDVNAIQVFSVAQQQWLTPVLNSTDSSTRFFGLSISPDSSKLAVTDAGTQQIYLVDLTTKTSQKFSVPVQPGYGETPSAIAVADSGMIYFATYYTEVDGTTLLHSLNPSTGVFTDYNEISATAYSGDIPTRLLLSLDGTRLFGNNGWLWMLDTGSGQIYSNNLVPLGDYELALASNQTWMSANEYLMDTNLNVSSYLVYNERESVTASPIYGTKLSADGKLVFSPETQAITIFDGETGTMRGRVALTFKLASTFDSLVTNGKDNVLVGITGDNADGLAVIDLNSLPEPLPHSYSSTGKILPMAQLRTGAPEVRSKVHEPMSMKADASLLAAKPAPPTKSDRAFKKTLLRMKAY